MTGACPRAPWLAAALCAVLLWAPAQAETDKRDYSAAERLLFMTPQLRGLQAPMMLRYSFARSGSLEPAFSDSVAVALNPRSDGRCCDAKGQFLSGAQREQMPEVADAQGNPVLLYFLEHDVRLMNRLTRGSGNHFRQRIRMAVYRSAEVRTVALRYLGRPIEGKEIVISPFLDDPNRARFEKFARKHYRFTLSDAVPGGIYAIHTSIPGDGAAAAPLLVEELRIDGAGAPHS